MIPDEQQQGALAIARGLIDCGVPVFIAPPDASHPTGFALPRGWQDSAPDATVLRAWRPGVGLAVVTGHGVDVVDLDPRNGGRDDALAGHLPRRYALAATPSGGVHMFVRSLSVRKVQNLHPGIDFQAGTVDGGRGFVWIAPTVRASKVDGRLRPYRWVEAPDVARLRRVLAGEETDDTGADLRRLIEQRQQASKPLQPTYDGPAFAELPLSLQVIAPQYTDATVAGILTDLDRAADWPPGHTDDRGRGWEKLTADAAMRLGALARASWSPLEPDEAWSLLTEHAPTDDAWSDRDVAAKWSSQANRGAPLPFPDPARAAERDAQAWAAVGVDVAAVLPVVSPTTQVTAEAHPTTPGHNPRSTRDAHLSETVVHRALLGRFCWAGGLGWMVYRPDSGRWVSTEEAIVLEAVRRDVMKQAAEEAAAGGDEQRLKELAGALAAGRLGGLLRLAKGQITVESKAFDQHPDLLCAGNGVVELQTGGLLPHDPSLLLTKGTSVDYRPGARSTDWDAALRAVPDEVAPWLQVRLGQAATGHPSSDDVMPVLQGSGSNGKTTLMGSVLQALGEYAVTVPERVLLANPSDHPTELMTLRGARLALIEETPEGNRLNVKRLKDVLGSPMMTARAIRRDNVTWKASHSLVLTTNYTPVVAETDHGTWRRLCLVRFPYTFLPPGQRARQGHQRESIVGIRERLFDGRDGAHEAVLAWIIEGATQWYANERVMPSPPPRVRADTEDWRAEADLVLAYFADRLVADHRGHVMARDLAHDFATYAEQRGQATWSEKLFASRFADHDVVQTAGVVKRRVRSAEKDLPALFRPTGPGGAQLPQAPVPSQYTAWIGLRFRNSADDAANAEAVA